MTDYVELHCHSYWSFLEGASSVEELVFQAKRLGYDALALTDHDGLHGAMEFAQTCRAWGLRPITGAELTLEQGNHLTLLAASPVGYSNLCRLLSYAHLNAPRGEPLLPLAILRDHTDGLIALSGCPKGELPSLLVQSRWQQAEETARRFQEWFDGRFYLEVQYTLAPDDASRGRRLADLGHRLDIPVVATGNVHYHLPERSQLQDVLVAVKHRTTLDGSHRFRRPNSQYYLKSPEAMAALFAELPEALITTRSIAEQCADFDLTRDLDYRFPDYPCPPGMTPDEVLRRFCERELHERYRPMRRSAQERLEEELRLIGRHGLSGFFLAYQQILDLARTVAVEVRGRPYDGLAPARGRGSSVSSVVCYLLGLSHIDPLQYDLFLGRFLNEELPSVPDIDIDLPRDVREALIKRVIQVWGKEHAALVCAFPTYHIKGAIRDVGKALGLPMTEVDRLAKSVEHRRARDLAEEMRQIPQFKERVEAPLWRDLVRLSAEIDGFPRHVSQHVGGIVLAGRPLIDLVPVMQSAMAGRYLIQWDKDSVDDARMVKIDLLALGALSQVDEALDMIAETDGRRLDLTRLDFKDKRVFDGICAGDTIGIFQIESRAQQQTLPRTQPRTLEDLVVEVAIIRPGPIVGKAVNPYILRRQGKETVTYDHPSLEPVLRETLGVILYQEQVIEVAMALAGFTAAQGEGLRRAMGRKHSQAAMQAFHRQFLEGALARGVDGEVAEGVFTKLLAFAEFGFNKAHAAAFAVLAYQAAWLRTYYPAHFLAGLLNQQPMGFYSPEVLVGDAKRHGVEVRAPDANSSRVSCHVESDGAVRLGLRFVKGVEAKTAQALVGERERRGPYRSLPDFLRRTYVSRQQAEGLILGGAFDWTGLERRELLWQVGLVQRPVGQQMPLPLETAQDMVPLRGAPSLNPSGVPEGEERRPAAGVPLEPMTAWERLSGEYGTLGLSPYSHPLGLLRAHLHEGIVPAAQLAHLPDGVEVQVAGLVVCRQRPGTAGGIVFMVLEDETGLANLIVYPDLYQRQRLVAGLEPFLVVRGQLQRRDGLTNVIAQGFQPLRAVARKPTAISPPRARNFY